MIATSKGVAPALLALAGLLGSSRAAASDTEEEAFRQASLLHDQKEYPRACPQLGAVLERSVDPPLAWVERTAACYREWGKTASAWSYYRRAASLARARDDERTARRQAAVDELDPELTRLRVHVSDALKGQDQLVIMLDERELPPATWGVDVPVDPGPRRLIAKVGELRHEVPITCDHPRQEITLDVWPALAEKRELARVERPEPPQPPQAPPPRGVGAVGIVGGVLTGVGDIGGGVGIGLGLADPDHACTPRGCNALGKEAADGARRQGDIATGVFFASAGVAVVGAVLIVIEATTTRPRARAAFSGDFAIGDYRIMPPLLSYEVR